MAIHQVIRTLFITFPQTCLTSFLNWWLWLDQKLPSISNILSNLILFLPKIYLYNEHHHCFSSCFSFLNFGHLRRFCAQFFSGNAFTLAQEILSSFFQEMLFRQLNNFQEIHLRKFSAQLFSEIAFTSFFRKFSANFFRKCIYVSLIILHLPHLRKFSSQSFSGNALTSAQLFSGNTFPSSQKILISNIFRKRIYVSSVNSQLNYFQDMHLRQFRKLSA